MSSGAVAEKTTTATVGMGQIAIGDQTTQLTAVLGSCIGVSLFSPKKRVAALAHVVLPDSNGHAAPPGKFADTAIPHMLLLLKQRGVNVSTGLVAKMVGGACMFGLGGPLQIGDANAKAVAELLERNNLFLKGSDVGGTSGRRVTLNCGTGEMCVDRIGSESKTI